jgi:hypothetical protein
MLNSDGELRLVICDAPTELWVGRERVSMKNRLGSWHEAHENFPVSSTCPSDDGWSSVISPE